ncbi:hypothetical protein Tco_1118963 [Tanacetum coccineum]
MALSFVQFRRTSLTGFPAQSIRSSNAIALDSPYLLVLITGTSQSRQHVDVAIVVLSSVAIVEEGKATVVKEGVISTFAEVIEDRVSVKGEDFAIVTLL